MFAPMNAEHVIALADTLRAHAQASRQDLNASNLFVHAMLMRALEHDGREASAPLTSDAIATELRQFRLPL